MMRVVEFLRQSDAKWFDIRHMQTLCWMIVGIIHSERVHLSVWGVYTQSRAVFAPSHQRRFRRWLSNRRINLVGVYQALLKQALLGWGDHRLYLSLDTTMVWNRFCNARVRSSLPGADDSTRLAGGAPSQQHGASMGDSKCT